MMFLALAGVFGSNLESMSRAQATTRASMFADRILSSCEAQSGAALLAMNGNSFFDGSDERVSRFRATLVVEVSSAALLTLRLDIADLRSGDEILSLLTLRQRT